MTTENLNYFYDAQIRRYLLQVSRVFSNFFYKTGKQRDGQRQLRRVPAKHAHINRQAAHILRNNSTNTLLSTPMITFFISDISMAPDRRINPQHVENSYFTERAVDPETQEYTTEPGQRYKLTRYMAVPYDLTIQVDIWTSNMMQKEQLLEQILMLFNPSVDIQHSTNPYDWASLVILTLNNVTWSSKSIPIGTDDEIDVATLTFTLNAWISPPANLHQQNIIQNIIKNIYQMEAFEQAHADIGTDLDYSEHDMMARIITTPGNHKIKVDEDEITLLTSYGDETDKNGNILSWYDLIKLYGEMRSGISQLLLILSDDIDKYRLDVVGYIEFHPTEENKLVWTIDPMTLPSNTLDSINAIIDPDSVYPGNQLPSESSGQRYIILNGIDSNNQNWGSLKANENDIIEYDGNKWFVAFDSLKNKEIEIVHHSNQNKQLLWDGNVWQYAIDAVYNEGFWRLKL